MTTKCRPYSETVVVTGATANTNTAWPDTREQRKRSMRDLLQQDRLRLISAHPFIAELALHLYLVPVCDERLRSACTDGHSVFFDVGFMQQLSPYNRLFVLAHEVWHCAAGHLQRRSDCIPELWNLACDHEANNLLIADGFLPPDTAVWYPHLAGRSAEQVYHWLIRNPHEGVSFDDHGPFPDSSDDPARHDPDFTPRPVDDATVETWQDRLGEASSHALQRGQLSGQMASLLKSMTVSQQNWRALLRQFIQHRRMARSSWSPPSRRHTHSGMYLPRRQRHGIRLIVALDTSGSMLGMMPDFLGELHGILRCMPDLHITLLQCDATIRQRIELESRDGFSTADLEIRGMGGTDLRPPFVAAQDEPCDGLIYLTDGLGPAPESAPPIPVLWVLPEDMEAPARWGMRVHIQGISAMEIDLDHL